MIILTVLYYGGSMVSSNVITVGNLTSFILYAAYVGIGLSGMSTFYAEVMKGLGASTRLWELVDRRPAVAITGGVVPNTRPSGRVRFDNIDFSYPSRTDVPIIRGLDLDIPAVKLLINLSKPGLKQYSLTLGQRCCYCRQFRFW